MVNFFFDSPEALSRSGLSLTWLGKDKGKTYVISCMYRMMIKLWVYFLTWLGKEFGSFSSFLMPPGPGWSPRGPKRPPIDPFSPLNPRTFRAGRRGHRDLRRRT